MSVLKASMFIRNPVFPSNCYAVFARILQNLMYLAGSLRPHHLRNDISAHLPCSVNKSSVGINGMQDT